jgi:phosphoserine phosphatase
MTIGLFLDVDNTLTRGFIQQCYARMVGVGDEHLEIESAYGSNNISSDEFGEKIIELFNRTSFCEQFAYDNFTKIPLKDSADLLLKCRSPTVEIYFVSSGPSYYVSKLAEKYKIPSENILCSDYKFDRDGKLLECNAVTPKQKHDFREDHARSHDLTIGVGDDELHDSSFLDGCDIGLLTPKAGTAGRMVSDNHLWTPRLSLILSLVLKLDKKMRTLGCQGAKAI